MALLFFGSPETLYMYM